MLLIDFYLLHVALQSLGPAVVQLVETLRSKPEGCGFDLRWRHWNFSLTYSCCPHCGPGVDSASNRNGYQKYFLEGEGGRCVGLITLPPSCADCLEIWEPRPPGTLWACPGLYRNSDLMGCSICGLAHDFTNSFCRYRVVESLHKNFYSDSESSIFKTR
jgi:hypothetical protein